MSFRSTTVVLLWSCGLFGPLAATASGQQIYCTQGNGVDAKIRRSNLDGSNIEDLVTCVLNVPSGLAPDRGSGLIYWINSDRVQRAGIDISAGETACTRTDIETLVTAPPGRHLHDLVLDTCRGLMFYSDGGTVPPTPTSIFRADLNGSNPQAIITVDLGRSAGFLALDSCSGKLYWNANDDVPTFKIQRANLDGTNVEDLVTGPGGVKEVQLDVRYGKMYWTPSIGSTPKIYRANLEIPAGETPSTRTDIEDLVCPPVVGSDTERPYSLLLELDAARMYWSDAGTGRIYSAQIDIPAGQTCSNRSDIVQPPPWTGFNASALAFETEACTDCNGNGIPDECEMPLPLCQCETVCQCVNTVIGSGNFQATVGGCLVTPDSALEICIEPGDLFADASLSVAEVPITQRDVELLLTPAPGRGVAVALYDLDPDGLTFQNPVTLTIVKDVSGLNRNQRERLDLYFRGDGGGPFEPLGATCCVDEVPPGSGTFIGKCTTPLTHFSTYGFIAPLDTDGDGVFDDFAGIMDNCPTVANPKQEDPDGDGIGHACDAGDIPTVSAWELAIAALLILVAGTLTIRRALAECA